MAERLYQALPSLLMAYCHSTKDIQFIPKGCNKAHCTHWKYLLLKYEEIIKKLINKIGSNVHELHYQID